MCRHGRRRLRRRADGVRAHVQRRDIYLNQRLQLIGHVLRNALNVLYLVALLSGYPGKVMISNNNV